MAFNATGLTRLSSGGGANVYFYRSLDASAAVNSAAYFTGDAVNMLNIGDLIIQQEVGGAIDAPTSVTNGTLMWVLSNNGTVVDVSDGTAIVVTDSD